jgi:pimeloyl-ACP methyl ester carboxylesterase
MKTWMLATLMFMIAVATHQPAAQAQAQSQAQAPAPYGANPAAGHTAEINGIKIYYEIYGEGEPLVLLHGNGSSLAAFSSQIPELSKHFKVIAVDSRAQGRSTDSDAEITYALMASDMSALISQLHLGAVNVLGWSDGGNIGLELALAHPEQVKKLITFGANYTHVDYEAPPDEIKMQPDDPRLLNTQAAIAAAVKTRQPSTEAVQKKLSDLMEKYPNITIAQLHTIQTPILVVAGDHDAIKMEQTISLFRNLPHAQLWIVPGATHFVAMEQPEVVNRAAIAFFTTPYRDISSRYWTALLP